MNNSVSVIIPTKNGGDLFRQSLEMIFSQEIDFPLEVLVVDSGSTDHTLEICADFPVKILEIPPASFGHAATRNLAISKARSEFCVLTVQDAVPADRKWLSALVSPLEKNERLAGVFGQQVSRKDAHAFGKCCKLLWYKEWRDDWQAGHEQLPVDPEEWEKFTFDQKRRFARFDNVNSCIRRSVWQDIPFPDVRYAEDMAWAEKVLTSGFSIFWQPAARVFHSHDRSLAYEFQRSYVDVKTLTHLLGQESQSLTGANARSVIEWLVGEAERYLRSGKGEWSPGEWPVDCLSDADNCWQLNGKKERGALAAGEQPVRKFLLQQLFKGLSGPGWLKKIGRDVLYLSKKNRTGSGTPVDPLGFTGLQGRHRHFLNQLLQFYFDGSCKIDGTVDSVRFGAAVMVAGSFLGQYLKTAGIPEAEEIHPGSGGASGHHDFWGAVAGWYKQDYTLESAAISDLDRLLSTGV